MFPPPKAQSFGCANHGTVGLGSMGRGSGEQQPEFQPPRSWSEEPDVRKIDDLRKDPRFFVDDDSGNVFWLHEGELLFSPISTDDTSDLAWPGAVEFDRIEYDAAGHSKLIEAVLWERQGASDKAEAARREGQELIAKAEAQDPSQRAWPQGVPEVSDYLAG